MAGVAVGFFGLTPTTLGYGAIIVLFALVPRFYDALAKAIERESPDLILFGQQAADSDGAVLWASVADRLRLPDRKFNRGIGMFAAQPGVVQQSVTRLVVQDEVILRVPVQPRPLVPDMKPIGA